MEDFEVQPVSRLWRNRIPVGLATLLAGISFYLGLTYFTADCPRLQQLLLAISLASFWLLCVGFLVFGPDGPIEQLIAVVLMVAIGLGLPLFGGDFLASVPQLRSRFCQACASREAIKQALLEGKPESAFDFAVQCGPTENDLQIEALLDWSDKLKATDCPLALEKLLEAQRLVDDPKTKRLTNTLKQRVREKLQAYKDSRACGPTPTPTATTPPTPIPDPTATPMPTPVLAITKLGSRPGKGVIDFRLTADLTPVPGLTQAEAALSTANQTKLPIKGLVERSKNDPICVIAIVDNSRSITELDLLRDAIAGLNETRAQRPTLELGMIVFDTKIVQQVPPSAKELDVDLITGTGGNTALWLGVDTGITMAKRCTAPALDRYLFVVTDGADNASAIKKADIISKANSDGIGICTVGIKSKDLQPQPLKDAAVGCSYQFAEDITMVQNQLQTFLYDTENSYRLTTDPYDCPAKLEVRGTSLEVCP